MKKIISLLVLVLLTSCYQHSYYVAEYELIGDADTVTVEYYDSNEAIVIESVTLPWSSRILVQDGNSVRLHASNEGTGTMYAAVYWIQEARTLTYRATHSDEDILIKGRIK
ncbi:MAG: hypothetical protein JRJ00_00335 [Deltaproteobacteria bacterium]|nr:hypothetical protein [Deltaproteobacteria bacterium]